MSLLSKQLAANSNDDRKYLGTAETLSVILQHRKIISECIKMMDQEQLNYISEPRLFAQVNKYTNNLKSELKTRIRTALSTDNLLQSHLLMDVEKRNGESRLYFQSSVLGIVRLCDVSLFKKLTDVQLKGHISFLNQAHKDLRSGKYYFNEDDDDFSEFIDNLLMNLGALLSSIRQNVVKMNSIGKDLESITSNSVSTDLDTESYLQAKEQWLQEIVKLYERHMVPVLQFLNPDTKYADYEGLHCVLEKIRDLLHSHRKEDLAANIQNYIISFLNFYQPIEATAQAVNRFIYKERDSIKRFNAIEFFYQNKLLTALAETQSDNLNKRFIASSAVILPNFSPFIKVTSRPQGYAFGQSAAYYKNVFNELEARVSDIALIGHFTSILSTSSKNEESNRKQLRFEQLIALIDNISLRETQDLTAMVHARLHDSFIEYELFDLISAIQFFKALEKSTPQQFKLVQTNYFSEIKNESCSYKYRRIKCIGSSLGKQA